MAMVESGRGRRKFVKRQGPKKSNKKARVMKPPHGQKKVKIDQKMKKLFRKRAREYNSDDEEDEATVTAASETRRLAPITNKKTEEDDMESEDQSEDEGAAGVPKKLNKNATDMNDHSSDDEGEDDNEIPPGITKFTEGCRAFKMAFRNVMKKSVPDEMLVSYLITGDYDFTEHWETRFFKTWIICRVQYCQHTRNLL